MNILSAGATDPGKKRKNNEDAYLVDDTLRVYAVADGVGGQAAGEVASRMAVEALRAVLAGPFSADVVAPPEPSGKEAPESAWLRRTMRLANESVLEAAGRDPALSGMASTLTALVLRRGAAFIMHAGDSRAYLFRGGLLQQLTVDHGVVAELVRAGVLTPERARTHPYRHVITRAVGIEDDLAPEGVELPLEADDLFLLCTDGLTELLEDEDIRAVLASRPPADAVRALIDLANDRGGVDNITVVVVKVIGD